MTLAQFNKYFKDRYGLTVTAVTKGAQLLYTDWNPVHQKRLPEKLSKLLDANVSQLLVSSNPLARLLSTTQPNYLANTRQANGWTHELIVSYGGEGDTTITGPNIKLHLK